jgi:hypothetical protein
MEVYLNLKFRNLFEKVCFGGHIIALTVAVFYLLTAGFWMFWIPMGFSSTWLGFFLYTRLEFKK